ncbi:hypothetical protein V8C86DRAFT_2868504 [Haematococcus lacustris]
MPSKIQRMSEKFRQALGIGQSANTDWRPTSNARNCAMIVETKRFSTELKALHRDLVGLDKAVEVSLGTVRGVLCTPLPRAYDEGPLGVSPVDKEERVVGMAVNIEAVTAAGAEMRGRLQNEVLHPLEQWLAAYRSIKERNRKCEELRLDLDTKRRSAMALQEKYLKYKKKEHQDTEAVMHRAQTEEFKMNRIAQRYAEVEAEVFNALLTLIRDTVVLREYAAAALAILQRCFTLAYTAFDLNTTIPLPLLPPPAVSNGGMPPNHSGGGNSEAGNVRSSTASLPNYSPSIATARSYNSTGGGAQGFNASVLHGVPPRAPPSPNADQSSAAQRAGPFSRPSQGALDPSLPCVSAAVPGEDGAGLGPRPPAWFEEAKQNARPPTYGDDSDDEAGANPFQAKHQLDTDNPFSRHSELGSDTAHLASPTSH